MKKFLGLGGVTTDQIGPLTKWLQVAIFELCEK